jgi:cytochrome c-type biogenesis protein CcmH/NrfG
MHADYDPDTQLPRWFYAFVLALFACAYLWVSNADYQYERAWECANLGKQHNPSTDLCEKLPHA